jgi:hypothetical protein
MTFTWETTFISLCPKGWELVPVKTDSYFHVRPLVKVESNLEHTNPYWEFLMWNVRFRF